MARYLISYKASQSHGLCGSYLQLAGSFIEFLPILELLKKAYTPQDLPCHFIVPSLPGFAFSDRPPLDKDFNLYDVARIFNHLMIALGFKDGYVVQGGDIGSKTARLMAINYPSCKGNQRFFEPNSVRKG